LLCDPTTSTSKQTKAIAKSITRNINQVDALHEKLGPTYWKEVVNMLAVHPKKLLDKSHPDYQLKVKGNTYTMDGWLNVLMHNPQFLKAPIAIFNGNAILCERPTDILKLDSTSKSAYKIPPHLRSAV
jgi:arsenate reductase